MLVLLDTTLLWLLSRPEIMASRSGSTNGSASESSRGFDVVLGNPPWERIKLQEQEFFAAREPEIAQAPNAAARGKLIVKLKAAAIGTRERALYDEFEAARRAAEASSVFAHVDGGEAGRFPLTGRGDINTYALFAELFANLVSQHGCAGVIVPTGIATDATTAPFFGSLVEEHRLRSLVSFENEEFIFPSVHHSFRFSLLVISSQKQTHPLFAFFLRRPEALADPERYFTLSSESIAALNPNTKTAPVFRSRADAELTSKIYARVPVLIDESKGKEGNPWGVSFMRMFDMAGDSGLFYTAAQLREAGFVRHGSDWAPPQGASPKQGALALVGGRDERSLELEGGGPGRSFERYVPLYEAKMIHQFDHRWATYDGIESRDVTDAERLNPAFEPTPRYWVPKDEVAERLATKCWRRDWLMGWRDICRSHDLRTMIGTPIPLAGCGDKFLLMLPSERNQRAAGLAANISSIVADYVVRQKLGGASFKYFTMRQIPFLLPTLYGDRQLAFIVPRVLELAYTSHSMAPFAHDLGYDGPPFRWDEERRALLRAELDAWYARAYGLTRDELRYVLDPADAMGQDYPSETFRVLKKNEIARFGEYRTARLVLQSWGRMEGELQT
jgi:hypothetical protein